MGRQHCRVRASASKRTVERGLSSAPQVVDALISMWLIPMVPLVVISFVRVKPEAPMLVCFWGVVKPEAPLLACFLGVVKPLAPLLAETGCFSGETV